MEGFMRIAVVALLCSLSAAAQVIAIHDNGVKKDLDCNGLDVMVAGNDARLRLRGDCKRVTVTGNDNTVTVDGAERLEVLGNENEVTWARGVGADAPRVSNVGNRNSVRQAGAKVLRVDDGSEHVEIMGSGSTLSIGSSAGGVTLSGANAGRSAGSVAVSSSGSSSGGKLVLNASGSTDTLECQGRTVTINGSSNTYDFRGDCESLVVNGTHNEVTLDGVRKIVVPGAHNQIRWARALGRDAPTITVNGVQSRVSQSR